jgi:hypothetical protein
MRQSSTDSRYTAATDATMTLRLGRVEWRDSSWCRLGFQLPVSSFDVEGVDDA